MDLAQLRSDFLQRTKQQIASSVGDDQLIIQAVQTMEELTKTCNALSKRARHWLALTFPEFAHDVTDHDVLMKKLLQNWEQARQQGMGATLSSADEAPLRKLVEEVHALYVAKAELLTYIETVMQRHAPNVLAMVGASLGGKLIESVGSLKKLASCHSSTIQLLGAEKALFRHIKNKSARPPKHGFLIQHPLVAKAKQKGKVVRSLADKLSIAARVDYFKGQFIGDQLRKQLEEKFA